MRNFRTVIKVQYSKENQYCGKQNGMEWGGGGGGWNGIGGLQHFNKNEGNNGGTVFGGRYWVALLTSYTVVI